MEPPARGFIDRRLLDVISQRMIDEPVVLLQGPRAVGKSTLLRAIAARTGAAVVDLDDLAMRDAVSNDPALFVSGPSPVCIDEYQHLPIVLDAIKAELNQDGRAGRFVLTGSARHESLPIVAQALTGRLHRLAVYPLSQRELEGTDGSWLASAFDAPEATITARPSTSTREEYIDRVVAGGLPPALQRSTAAARGRWFDDYVRLTLERDVRALSRVQQAAALPRLLERLAGQTGQILNVTRVASDLGLKERTVDGYIRLLEAVFLVHRFPAWGSTLSTRATARPKLHVVDPGLAARLLRLSVDKLNQRDPTVLTELGHLLETFVVGEVLAQASWMDGIHDAGHWRATNGNEVDLVIERDDGALVAIEVKASQRVGGDDLRALKQLRDLAGPALKACFAVHLGNRSYTYDDRIHVVPIDHLWTTP